MTMYPRLLPSKGKFTPEPAATAGSEAFGGSTGHPGDLNKK